MQDRYVGDAGDFGKYGLLRALCSPEPSISLGVVWYFTPDDKKINHDRHSFLDPNHPDFQLYSECDPTLYETLGKISRSNPTIAGIEVGGVLQDDTVFFSEPVPHRQGNRGVEKRRVWTQATVEQTKDCDLVLVDADTGLQPPGHRGNTKPEHARIDELKPYVDRGRA